MNDAVSKESSTSLQLAPGTTPPPKSANPPRFKAGDPNTIMDWIIRRDEKHNGVVRQMESELAGKCKSIKNLEEKMVAKAKKEELIGHLVNCLKAWHAERMMDTKRKGE